LLDDDEEDIARKPERRASRKSVPREGGLPING
jgi:hypothetical protein